MKYYFKYTNGNDWIQVTGDGDDPKACSDISWTSSKGNKVIREVELFSAINHPVYGTVDPNSETNKGNIYIQVFKLSPVIKDGYEFDSSNVPELSAQKDSLKDVIE